MASQQATSPRFGSGNASSGRIVPGTDNPLLLELTADRLHWDSKMPFELLIHPELSTELVDKCMNYIQTDKAVQDAFKELSTLEANALGGKRRELEMHEHLLLIYNAITYYGAPKPEDKAGQTQKRLGPAVIRRFLDESSTLTFSEEQSKSISSIRPDMTIASVEVTKKADYTQVVNLDAFVELKASRSQRPRASRGGTPEILVDCAEYARAFTCCRPFRAFSVGFLHTGGEFCIAIFDRGKATFSEVLTLWGQGANIDHRKSFVRLVLSMTRYLGDNALGLYPTVTKVPCPVTPASPPQSDGVKPAHLNCCYLIEEKHDYKKPFKSLLITDGAFVSTSLSLFGRGTQVWKVRRTYLWGKADGATKNDYLELDASTYSEHAVNAKSGSSIMVHPSTFILKEAWRDSERVSETTIYEAVETLRAEVNKPLGIAKCIWGWDVLFKIRKDSLGKALLTVDTLLRSLLPSTPQRREEASKPDKSPVLHRMLLETVGQRLAEYNNDLELLEGIQTVGEGVLQIEDTLQWLHENHILHRDISYGNILLGEGSNAPKGFLLDFEYAWLKEQHKTDSIREHEHQGQLVQNVHTTFHENFQSYPRGVKMTGTLLFAAYDLLSAVRHKTPFSHEPRHDVESLYWVIGYTIMLKLLDAVPETERKMKGAAAEDTVCSKLMSAAHAHFGGLTLQQLCDSRRAGGPLQWMFHEPAIFAFFGDNVSPALMKLILSMSKDFDEPAPAGKDAAYAAFLARTPGDNSAETLRKLEIPARPLLLSKLMGYIETAVTEEKKRLAGAALLAKKQKGLKG